MTELIGQYCAWPQFRSGSGYDGKSARMWIRRFGIARAQLRQVPGLEADSVTRLNWELEAARRRTEE